MARIVAIIQARMGSSRLPGKVLQDISGEPMLVRVFERTRRASLIDEVLIATTDQESDDPVAELCTRRGYPFYRGSLHDVLDRFYHAARSRVADIVVRVTADCPVIDPGLIDRTVKAFFGDTQPQDKIISQRAGRLAFLPSPGKFDFAANRLPEPWRRTYPIGLDVEVCSFAALEYAWEHADKAHEREHVMPYLYQTADLFSNVLIHHEKDYGMLRWTVDTPADLDLICEVYARFAGRDDFTWLDVLALFEREPELARINAEVKHKGLYDVDERTKGDFRA
jgi:spore coat polysaccharide biosynthesis protein SpsF